MSHQGQGAPQRGHAPQSSADYFALHQQQQQQGFGGASQSSFREEGLLSRQEVQGGPLGTPMGSGTYTPGAYSYFDDADSSMAYGRPGLSSQPTGSFMGGAKAGGYDSDEGSTADLGSRGLRAPPGLAYGTSNQPSGLRQSGSTRRPQRYPMGEKNGGSWWGRKSRAFKRWIIIAAVLFFIIIALAIAIPVVTISKKADGNVASASDKNTTINGVPTGNATVDWRTAAVGANGSTVYTEDGSSFLYNNSFGGFWNAIPFNDTARPQSDTPALNETWDYNNNLIHGVNLGGWLVIEPFIVPGLFEPFDDGSTDPLATHTVVDEWTLSVALGSNLSTVIENHYRTWITEKDFAEIAGAGLNWVRLNVGWWMIETWDGEPYLANVSWEYLMKAFAWARKYGLRVNLDIHSVPGSQNGYNHSGRQGSINFLNGVMGVANAQRTLNYIRTLTEFISQPQYKNVVPMFGPLNEPYATTIGVDTLRYFYTEVYQMIRGISGIGEGNGPMISYHDGFVRQAQNVSSGGWNGFLPGADRMAIDSHNYLCFSTPNNDGLSYQAAKPCTYWAYAFNVSTAQFGVSMGGEWSLAINDCGKWLNNVGNGARFDGTYYTPGNTTAPTFAAVGNCSDWTDYSRYSDATKAGLRLVALGHMDALRHWFMWTWKTGYSQQEGKIVNPLWNYQLGLQQGWIPDSPRSALGSCPSLVAQNEVVMSTMSASVTGWMTGGPGANTIDAAALASWNQWPPPSIGANPTPVSNLPTFTPTGRVITMTAATPTSYPAGFNSTTADVGDGWYQATDTASGWYTPVAGCSYPDAWSGVQATIPSAACTGGARRMRKAVMPVITPAPR